MGRSKRIAAKQIAAGVTDAIVRFFRENQSAELTAKQICKNIGISSSYYAVCYEILADLAFDGYLKDNNGVFSLAIKDSCLEGTIVRKTSGRYLFVSAEDPEDKVQVAERNLNGALNGDRVKLVRFAARLHSAPEGKVLEVLQRSRDTFVGTLQVDRRFAFLTTGSRVGYDIFIPKQNLKGGLNGQKAVVKVIEWPSKGNPSPIGKVIDILGNEGDNNTEMHAILAEFGLPYSYPENVAAYARNIPSGFTANDLEGRQDFRSTFTITIDPRDAKDFDDAISIKALKNGWYQVGVHIADVSHYVKEGDLIDKEAFKRATSVYLVDRTIPMLPERLCNDLCSLNPGADKLAYSVIFTISASGAVKEYQITRTVINSNCRFTYEQVQDIIENRADRKMLETLPGHEYAPDILVLNDMAQELRKKRMADGSIDFDRQEVRFEIDENGKPLSVFFKKSLEANQLIEEFMLLANRSVAQFIGDGNSKTKKTFVYRIHEKPDPEKLERLSQFISRFGHKIKTDGSKNELSRSINRLLSDVRGKKEQNLVEMISLRSMPKALYSTHNTGHYGLSFDYYTHFTSPIRRYPDLMVHRLLTRYLAQGRSVNQQHLEDNCEHCSNMEQVAEQAERASIRYKQVEYMSERMGIPFQAHISGVTEWGIYAEIDQNKCEGLISIHDLDGDYYEFDQKNFCLIGQRTHKRYSLGDPIVIEVKNCNLEKKQMDFIISK